MARRTAALAVAVVALAACSSSGSTTTTGASVSGTVAGVGNNCLDEPGTASGTLREWYSDVYNGMPNFDAHRQATVSDRGVAFGQAVERAIIDQLPMLESRGIGERAEVDDPCIAVRSISFRSADGAVVNVIVWRPADFGQRLGMPTVGAASISDDHSVVAELDHLTTALMVAADGTTALIMAYGSNEQTRMEGWPTTRPAPSNLPESGPTPVTAEQATAIAGEVLAAALDR